MKRHLVPRQSHVFDGRHKADIIGHQLQYATDWQAYLGPYANRL